jgi:transaldolase
MAGREPPEPDGQNPGHACRDPGHPAVDRRRENINITLLFGLPRYQEVIDAYFSGLESRVSQGLPIRTISSVASFFLSRIDVLVDPLLDTIIHGSDAAKARSAQTLHGQVAIASAKGAYQIFEEAVKSQRFQKLWARGAQQQRLLWASTSTKNPAYSDTKYIEPLIGPQTVNTLTIEALNAYRDHGSPANRLRDGLGQASIHLQNLAELGIQIDHVTHQLEAEGVEKFDKSYDQLLQRLAEKVTAA